MTRHHNYPQPVLNWAEPFDAFGPEFLARARTLALAPTQSFSLKGLHAYWQRQGSDRTAENFQAGAWAGIQRFSEQLPRAASAFQVWKALHERYSQATHAGPLWMESTAFNELLSSTVQVLEDLAQETLNQALRATPLGSLLPAYELVEHSATKQRAAVLSATQFDSNGLIYSVLVEGQAFPDSWSVTAVQWLP